jgi:hypothetical protein
MLLPNVDAKILARYLRNERHRTHTDKGQIPLRDTTTERFRRALIVPIRHTTIRPLRSLGPIAAEKMTPTQHTKREGELVWLVNKPRHLSQSTLKNDYQPQCLHLRLKPMREQ